MTLFRLKILFNLYSFWKCLSIKFRNTRPMLVDTYLLYGDCTNDIEDYTNDVEDNTNDMEDYINDIAFAIFSCFIIINFTVVIDPLHITCIF